MRQLEIWAATIAVSIAVPSVIPRAVWAQEKSEIKIEADAKVIILDPDEVLDEAAVKKAIKKVIEKAIENTDELDAEAKKKAATEIEKAFKGADKAGHQSTLTLGGVEAGAADRAWLGVQVESVPKILAKHLKIDSGEVVLIANVVKGSPAEAAKIGQYDIVVSIDGKPVKGGSEGFAKNLRERKKGSKISLGIVQAGERKTIEVELGPWKTSNIEYLFESPMAEIFGDRLEIRGGFFSPDSNDWKPSDRFVFKNIDIQGLHPVVIDGESGSGSRQSMQKYQKSTSKNGDELRIEVEVQVNDGKKNFKVRKTIKPKDGQKRVEERRFESESELKKVYPEAYKIFKKNKSAQIRTFKLGNFPGLDKEIKILIDGHVNSKPRRVVELSRKNMLHQWEPAKKIDRQFKVSEDGSISVKITKGSSTLETIFKSLEEFEKKEPALYKHYKMLLE